MFGNSDYNCWLATVTKVEGPNGDTKVWDPVTNVMGHCQLSDTAFCGYGTGVKSDGSFIQYNAIGKNFSGTPVGEVVFHEVVHFYQMAMHSDLSASGFRPDFPAWFTEGQANLFGMTIAAQGENAPQRNKAISEIKATITGAESFSESQWLSKLEELETNSGFVSQNGLGYSLGWLILEDFYQKYSFDQMNDLLTKLCIGETWGSALRLALGDSKEEIYTHVAKYLADQVK